MNTTWVLLQSCLHRILNHWANMHTIIFRIICTNNVSSYLYVYTYVYMYVSCISFMPIENCALFALDLIPHATCCRQWLGILWRNVKRTTHTEVYIQTNTLHFNVFMAGYTLSCCCYGGGVVWWLCISVKGTQRDYWIVIFKEFFFFFACCFYIYTIIYICACWSIYEILIFSFWY